MGSESIAHDSERNNCFSNIQLVGQKYQDKTKRDSAVIVLVVQSRRFSQLVGFVK